MVGSVDCMIVVGVVGLAVLYVRLGTLVDVPLFVLGDVSYVCSGMLRDVSFIILAMELKNGGRWCEARYVDMDEVRKCAMGTVYLWMDL